MPYTIRHDGPKGKEYCVYNTETGERRGCAPTKAEAVNFRTALYMHAGDKGVRMEQLQELYDLSGRPTKSQWLTYRKTVPVKVVVLERTETDAADVFAYRYGLRPGDMKPSREEDGFAVVGRSYVAGARLEEGDVFTVEAEMVGKTAKEGAEEVDLTFRVWSFAGPAEGPPDTMEQAIRDADARGVLQTKVLTSEGRARYQPTKPASTVGSAGSDADGRGEELSFKAPEEKTYSKEHCMLCSKPPTVSVLWANGKGLAWFCGECFEAWKKGSTEEGTAHADDIVKVHELKPGEDPHAWRGKQQKPFANVPGVGESLPESDELSCECPRCSHKQGQDFHRACYETKCSKCGSTMKLAGQSKAVTEVSKNHWHALDSLSPQGSGRTEPFAGEGGHKHRVKHFSVGEQEDHSHQISESTRRLFEKQEVATRSEGPVAKAKRAVRERFDELMGMLFPNGESELEISPDGLGMRTKQQADGRWRWTTISSTAYLDRDSPREIVSREAVAKSIARADESGEHGDLRFWHEQGTTLGTCDFQARHELCLVESGLYRDDAVGEAVRQSIEERGGEWGTSIGFLPLDSQEGMQIRGTLVPRVWTDIQIVERSILPKARAASLFTSIQNAGGNMDEQKKQTMIELLGKEMADMVLHEADEANAKSQELDAIFKGQGNDDDETKAESSLVEKLESLADDVQKDNPVAANRTRAIAKALGQDNPEPEKSESKAASPAEQLRKVAEMLEGTLKSRLMAIISALEGEEKAVCSECGKDPCECEEEQKTASDEIEQQILTIMQQVAGKIGTLETRMEQVEKAGTPRGVLQRASGGQQQQQESEGDQEQKSSSGEEVPRAVQFAAKRIMSSVGLEQ